MKIPKKLKIGGHDYKILVVDGEDQKKGNSNWGKTFHHQKEVYIDKSAAQSQREQTFFHEIIHCIDKVYNGDELVNADRGEATISRLAEGVYQVLKDNKLLK